MKLKRYWIEQCFSGTHSIRWAPSLKTTNQKPHWQVTDMISIWQCFMLQMKKKIDTLYRNSNFENRQSKRRDTTQCCFMLRFEGSDVVGFYIFIQFHPTDTHGEERSVLSLHLSLTSVSFFHRRQPLLQRYITKLTMINIHHEVCLTYFKQGNRNTLWILLHFEI